VPNAVPTPRDELGNGEDYQPEFLKSDPSVAQINKEILALRKHKKALKTKAALDLKLKNESCGETPQWCTCEGDAYLNRRKATARFAQHPGNSHSEIVDAEAEYLKEARQMKAARKWYNLNFKGMIKEELDDETEELDPDLNEKDATKKTAIDAHWEAVPMDDHAQGSRPWAAREQGCRITAVKR
jgi:hypothetical protein